VKNLLVAIIATLLMSCASMPRESAETMQKTQETNMVSVDQAFVLDLPIGITLSRDLTENSVANIAGVKKSDMNNGHTHYNLPAMQFNDERIIFTPYFFNGLITSIGITPSNAELYGKGFDDWSEEKERARAKAAGDWLSSIGYAPGEYEWGSVWASYDPRGAF